MPPENRTPNHEHRALERADGAGIRIEETDDFWVIPDCVLTRDGVMNGARKTWDELKRTFGMAEGIPLTHDHPSPEEMGLVIDLRRVSGFVADVRADDEHREVIGSYYLLKRPTPGYDVTPENVDRSRKLIAALRAGERQETSIGFWSTDEYVYPPQEHEGQAYDRIQRSIVYDHNAFVPLGACGERCSAGSAQQGDRHAHRPNGGKETKNGDMDMKPNQDCDKQELLDRLQKAEQRAQDAEKAARERAPPAAVPDADTKNELKLIRDELQALRDQQAQAEKARLDGKRRDLAALTVPIVAGKQDAAALAAQATAFEAWTEASLDWAIAREKQNRGRADPTRPGAPATEAASTVDGIVRVGNVFTVTDAKAALKASRTATTGAN